MDPDEVEVIMKECSDPDEIDGYIPYQSKFSTL